MDLLTQSTAIPETLPAHRPSTYSKQIADNFCQRLSLGMSVREICQSDDMPDRSQIFRWLQTYPEFRDQYALAREEQAETMADELLSIADDGTNDWMERHDKKTGECVGWRENGEAVRRSQLRVETRKWVAAKLLPKKYGDIKATNIQVVLNMPAGVQELLQVDAQEYLEGEK